MGKALTWYRLCDDIGYWNWNRLKLESHQKNIPCIQFIVIGITYIIFGPVKEKVSLQLGGGLSQCYIHAPIMSSQEIIIQNFYVLLSHNDQSMLDTSCAGSFMKKTIEFRWDILERIKRNFEDWELDKGKVIEAN